MNLSITPFNIKTDYSLLTSMITVKELTSFCFENNISVCGICDNNLSSSQEFLKLTKEKNIKPVIGLELKINTITVYLYPKTNKALTNLYKVYALSENNELYIDIIKSYINDVICVINISDINYYNEFKVFENIFIGYKNNEEKIRAKEITDDILFNKDIKVLREDDSEYLFYLNELGGKNNLNENNILLSIDSETTLEYNKIFNEINLSSTEKKLHIPVFDDSKDSYIYLKKLSTLGLSKRLNENVSLEYSKRLELELETIKGMNFTDYFLIVYDYVCYAKKNNIYVGPGRGSAAGSLVCYSIGITDIDPIKYDLLFERFLNKDRITMPDIDIDFDSEKREEIIKYVQNKYGKNKVAVGLTYNTFKAKSSIREIAKLKNINESLISKFSSVIDSSVNLKENLKKEEVLKYLDNYNNLKEVYDISLKIESLKKNISTHAAGIVICDEDLSNIIPVYSDNLMLKSGITMEYLEDLGILKMDFLGVKNLTTISNVLSVIGKDKLANINLEDELVLNLFKNGETDGIFQFETYAMKALLKKLKPANFGELIAAVALVRPGPSMFLDEYINNKNNKDSYYYYTDDYKDILKETYGVILYQEQIIRIMIKIGGFTSTNADIIRRAISKKNEVVLVKSKEAFINGAISKGYSKDVALEIFGKIELFANYGFNKSHSVAYALIGYQMAYLKVHYDSSFASTILKDTKDIDQVENYLRELKNKNVKVIKPDINYSEKEYFTKENQLILPLSLIKGVTSDIESKIITGRPYGDFFDFLIKNKNLSNSILHNLIHANALRSLKSGIKPLLESIDLVKNYVELDLPLEKPLLKLCEEYSSDFLKEKELELFGFYVGNHPSSTYKGNDILKLSNLKNKLFENIKLVVVIDKITKIKTKKGQDMAFLSVSDETSKIEVVVFNDKINLIDNLSKYDLVTILGKSSKQQDKINVIANNIMKMK